MRILFIGDICGKVGRQTVKKILPNLKKQKDIDFVIANAENSAGGRGVTKKILFELLSYGIDFFTSGDHAWRNKSFLDSMNDQNLPFIRPANFPDDVQFGRGFEVLNLGSKGKIAIINLQGWTYMNELVLNPLRYMDKLLDEIKEDKPFPIIVDLHAEATSEKAITGLYLDGRVSAVVGTHTHIGTSDARVLPQKTGFVTDVGSVGPLNSSLWVKKEIAIHNYLFPYKKPFKMEKNGKKVFNSVLIETENIRCLSISRIDIII